VARKDVLFTRLIANQSMASPFTSEPTIIQYTDNASYQINITTSDSTGSFTVEASLDYRKVGSGEAANAGSWSPLVLSGTPVATGVNDTQSISMNQLPFYAIRLRYTPTVAGTGTMTVFVSTKQIGG